MPPKNIYRSRKVVSCKYCFYEKNDECQLRVCPYVAERITAKVINYEKLILEFFKGNQPRLFSTRLRKHCRTYRHFSYLSTSHRKLFEQTRDEIARITYTPVCGADLAILYLSTSDELMSKHIIPLITHAKQLSWRFESNGSLNAKKYAIFKTAKQFTKGDFEINPQEFLSSEFVPDSTFSLIINALLLANYDQLLDQRLQNTGKVSGVFEIDFDRDTFSAANAMDGWHTYRIHDVSVAAYHAYRKQNISTDQRWDRLLDKLDGKELTPNSDVMVLTGSRRLCMNEITFQGDMSECGSLLNFYVPVTFDPDAVFGTNVATDANDDYLNVYADFDLDVGEVCDALTVIQVCGDGSEEAYRYPLTEEERSTLRSKMNDYCMEQAGMSLDDYRAQYLAEEMCSSSFTDGQTM